MTRKKIIALMMLLQLSVVLEAKEIISNDGVDIIRTKENTINASEPRSEAISADITGHTLTITFNDNVGIAHINLWRIHEYVHPYTRTTTIRLINS